METDFQQDVPLSPEDFLANKYGAGKDVPLSPEEFLARKYHTTPLPAVAPVAEPPHPVVAAKGEVETPTVESTPSAPTISHPNAAATQAPAPRKEAAPRPAPMPVRRVAAPARPTATAESDPDVGF